MRLMRVLTGLATLLIMVACQPQPSTSEKAASAQPAAQPASGESEVERGRYLVQLGGCNDCHSPKIGPKLDTTVFPFILRGVALLGMDSAQLPIDRRRAIWARLATDLRPRSIGDGLTEVTLDTLDGALDDIVAGGARGRWVVRVGEG